MRTVSWNSRTGECPFPSQRQMRRNKSAARERRERMDNITVRTQKYLLGLCAKIGCKLNELHNKKNRIARRAIECGLV